MPYEDTIVAISTGPGFGAIGIVRMSGPEALAIARAVTHRRRYLPGTATYTRVFRNEELVDEAVLTFFENPHSFTGEDTVELGLHGNPLILETVVEACIEQGARLAEPGEFTKRAFLNGRLDLTQAEAVMDVITAESALALRQAERQLRGELKHELVGLRGKLLEIIAGIEAWLDYPEEDVPALDTRQFAADIRSMLDAAKNLAASYRSARLMREGVQVALVGRPNAGKSSVFNALVREDRAIVTDIPGTTRDVIEGRTVMDGLVIRLRDTAGLRESEDVIEKLGVERTRQAMAEADITLAVLDGSLPLEPDDEALVRTVLGTDGIVVVNKSDLLQAFVPDPGWKAIAVSAKSGEGISKLEGAIGERLDGLTAGAKDQVLTNQRQLGCMERARDAFEFALRSATTGTPMDILAIDLKAAYAALGEITGETVGDTIIDEIFSRFCLGK